jgi:D-beta-D-heptose 7-phosphate kinase/D-beta-D-heptose 1-phosphate adenosyltransferase
VALFREIKINWPGCQLMVGVNCDRRAGEIKEHILFSDTERGFLVGSFRDVDFSFIFEEDTPSELIREIKPDIFVKGIDWDGKELPEAEACREVGAEIVFLGDKKYSSSVLKKRLFDAH